jgi:hypothetical protein
MAMRGFAFGFAISASILVPIGLAFSVAAPLPTQRGSTLASPAAAPEAPQTGVLAFPYCPAPAINGMNVRTVKRSDGAGITVFVVVQNIGHRAFFADAGMANLVVRVGDRTIGTFAVERLAPSEVKFFALESGLAAEETGRDLVATLDFATGVATGRVEDTRDCQTSDNRSVLRGQSIRASLDRSAS